MINPVSRDVGRAVKFRRYDENKMGHTIIGRIESYNTMMVFVMVEGEAKPFNRVELEWAKVNQRTTT